MRHRVLSSRFHCSTKHRALLFANMVFALVSYRKVITTLAKAKALRPLFEKLLTLAKKGSTLRTYRYLLSRLFNNQATVKALFAVAQEYVERPGGYTRIIKSGFRKGDCAPMAIIALV